MRTVILVAAVCLVIAKSAPLPVAAAESRPNVVWIWCDNLAYRDLGCYDSPTIRTPVIDQLARDGARLTQYYIGHVVCSPSRAALLTGRQPFRSGIIDVLRPDSPIGIPDDEITLGEAMRDAGYATMAIGKWHLGDRPQYLPTRHGFGAYLGLPYSMDMLPTILIRDDRIVEELAGSKVENITERYTDEAIRFITASRDKPFFLYLSHTLPHPPINLSPPHRTEGRPIYEDAIEHVDQQTGKLLAALDRLGLRDNTLVFFSSDNGPMSNGGDTGGLRGRIRSSYEGGVRVPLIARWPGKIPAGRDVDTPAIAYDIFPTLVHLAGARLANDRVYDGQDIWPLLNGNGDFQRQQPFYWIHTDKVTAVRDGNWKLHVGDGEKPLDKPELYDVAHDARESQPLGDQHPDVVQRLLKQIDEYQKQIPAMWRLMYNVRDPAKQSGGIRRD
jgi:arylsulfatase A